MAIGEVTFLLPYVNRRGSVADMDASSHGCSILHGRLMLGIYHRRSRCVPVIETVDDANNGRLPVSRIDASV